MMNVRPLPVVGTHTGSGSATILKHLDGLIKSNFKNPTPYQTRVSLQTHSLTVSFLENGEEKFAVDIVPALVSGIKNEFGDDIYFVPEILKINRNKRISFYAELDKNRTNEVEWWIKSDPRGYIKAASDLDHANSDFRKSVKMVKKWKFNCKNKDDGFELKSFHIEQVISSYFCENSSMEIFDVIFKFFCDLPKIMAKARIPDRADDGKMIDAYIDNLTPDQRKKIEQARDNFLIKLERFSGSSTVTSLLEAGFHNRASDAEAYLFDSAIPVLTDPSLVLKIDGFVKPLSGFSSGWLKETPQLLKGLTHGKGKKRYIEFSVKNTIDADLFKWKVKNDNQSPEPRGEITDHQTRNHPEATEYVGEHFVECFAVKDNVCVARARQNVKIV